MKLSSKQIGQLLTIVQSTQPATGLDEIAFITLMRICRDYVDIKRYPLIKDEKREKWFIERLNKFRIRFFEKI